MHSILCVCAADCSSVACLREGYAKQSSVPEYAAFVGSKDADGRPVIDGMWDDHDYVRDSPHTHTHTHIYPSVCLSVCLSVCMGGWLHCRV